MDVTLNGSYAPYLYIFMLQAALFFLQRPNHIRQLSGRRGASATVNVLIDLYCSLTALIASILSWCAWALAIWVAFHFGIPGGMLFFATIMVGSIFLPTIIPYGFAFDLVGHVISLFATPYLVVLTVRSLNCC